MHDVSRRAVSLQVAHPEANGIKGQIVADSPRILRTNSAVSKGIPQQNQGSRRTMSDDPQASSDDLSQEPDEKASETNTKDFEDLSNHRTMSDTSDDEIPIYSNGSADDSEAARMAEEERRAMQEETDSADESDVEFIEEELA